MPAGAPGGAVGCAESHHVGGKAAEAEVPKGPKMESCSCIEGNPCADAYCCKDWKNRFEVAKKNGWKLLPSSKREDTTALTDHI